MCPFSGRKLSLHKIIHWVSTGSRGLTQNRLLRETLGKTYLAECKGSQGLTQHLATRNSGAIPIPKPMISEIQKEREPREGRLSEGKIRFIKMHPV